MALFPSHHPFPSATCPVVQESALTHLSCSPPQAALQAAAHASVDIRNVLDFYRQWKEIG